MSYQVLIIEDEKTLADNIAKYLMRYGFTVRTSYSGKDGLACFQTYKPEVVLVDLNLGDMNGIDVLQEIRSRNPEVKVVLMTGYGTIEAAVKAMKSGAVEFLTKPVVLRKLRSLLEELVSDAGGQTSEEAGKTVLDKIIGESDSISLLKQQIKALLENENAAIGNHAPPVLITGETGTGKELVAQAVHYGSKRRSGPFIELNCTTLPDTLVESELFGHEKGAFTGAHVRKPGLFEAADGGSLFLDEIGDIPISIQLKLLRVLEDKEIRAVGSTSSRKVDVRIIAATNKSIETLVSEGRFRADLFFRLSTIQLETPPLRERETDTLLLSEYFLERQAHCYQKPKPKLSSAAKKLLLSYAWPGNIRELRNVMEQIVLLNPGSLVEADSPVLSHMRSYDARESAQNSDGLDLTSAEKKLLYTALDKTAWNVSAAARLLGVSRDTLRYRIKRFSLKRPESA